VKTKVKNEWNLSPIFSPKNLKCSTSGVGITAVRSYSILWTPWQPVQQVSLRAEVPRSQPAVQHCCAIRDTIPTKAELPPLERLILKAVCTCNDTHQFWWRSRFSGSGNAWCQQRPLGWLNSE
jgi:hypothetical protein